MVNEVAPNLSYHHWHLGIRGKNFDGEAQPLVMVRGSEFNHNKEKTFEDDLGHMGTATTKIDSYVSDASAEPEYSDYCRYLEGWEDIWLLVLGSEDSDGNIRKKTLADGVYQYDYLINVDKPQEPYFATLYNGFAKTDNDTWKYTDSLLNNFELSGSNTEATTYTAGYVSDFPKFRQPNIARNIPAKSVFAKPGDVAIYMAPFIDKKYVLGTPSSADEVSIASYKYPCYQEWSLSVNMNVEHQPCSDDDFGTSTKVQGERESEFNLTLPWNSKTKHLEYDFATGSDDDSLTTVTDENYYRTVWILMQNGKIGTTDYNYQTLIKIPKIHLTAVNSPQSGTDAKTLELSGNISETGLSSFIETSIITSLSDLHIDNGTVTSP